MLSTIYKRFLHTSMVLEKRSGRDFMSLEEFMFRKEVRKLYRQAVRTAYKTYMKDEMMNYLRGEFHSQGHVTELAQRRYLLHQGNKQFEMMCKTLGMGSR